MQVCSAAVAGDVVGSAGQHIERHPPIRHVVLAEKYAAATLTELARQDVAVVGIEHDPATSRIKFEHADQQMWQQVTGRVPVLMYSKSATATCRPKS